MRDALPQRPSRETGIINLDTRRGKGTHFVAYVKRNKHVRYFDSFGLRPPPEFMKMMRGMDVEYNMQQMQRDHDTNCGKLCLQFLYYEVIIRSRHTQ